MLFNRFHYGIAAIRRMGVIFSILALAIFPRSGLAQSTSSPTPAASIDTLGVYHNGVFFLALTNSPKFADLTVDFSAHPGLPIVGDWTGAGFDSIGTLDPKSGLFTLCKANDTQKCADLANLIRFAYGAPNNTPVAGKWQIQAAHDGIGTFDTVNGLFFLRNDLSTGNPDYIMIYGLPADQPTVGDWHGGGIDTPGIYRSKTGTFLLSNQMTNGTISTDLSVRFGITGYSYAPLAGKWISSAITSGIGLYDGALSLFLLDNSLSVGRNDLIAIYGAPHNLPVVGHWQAIYP